ncbi:MAG TPA: hypothetical protein VF432_16015 [Thermoanaerobaculia bacterium]
MRRALWVATLCLLSLAAVAQESGSADFAITALTVDKTTVLSGERVTLTLQVRNDGPGASIDTNINIFNTHGVRLLMVASSAPAGWQCSPLYTNCWASSFPSGGQATLTMTMLAPTQMRPDTSLTLTANGSSATDRSTANNRQQVTVTLQASQRAADLSVALAPPPSPVAKGTPIAVTFAARNNGPDPISNVRVPLRIDRTPFGQSSPIDFQADGWQCSSVVAGAFLCTRPQLAAGETAYIEARFTAPAIDSEVYLQADIYADQAHVDNDPSNDSEWFTVSIGNASDWSRILLPFVMEETPGANGSLWKAELTGLIDTTEGLRHVPTGCGGREDPCSPPPLKRAFDMRQQDFIVTQGPAQFVYVDKAHAHQFHVSTRVYDSAREEETAGAFVPSPRDEDFSAEGFALIGIPVAGQFRSMLRIYDYDARDAAEVLVELYGDDAETPFASNVYALDAGPQPFTLTTAQLPAAPAMAQVDLTPLVDAAAYERVRVSVRPVTPGLRLWGVVSITNNETHHVTVLTP